MPELLMIGKTEYAEILQVSLPTFNRNREKHPEWFAKPVVTMGRERWYIKSILEFHPGIIVPPSVLKTITDDHADEIRLTGKDIKNSAAEVCL